MELQNSKDWAKVYRACNFIEKGVCEYANERVYVSQDALQKSLMTMKGRPVIIDHKIGITPENMQEYAVGYVTGVELNNFEAGCDCQFVIFDDKGKEVIADGYSVSCAYKPIAFGPGGTWHNVPYDREIVELEFTHLALVQNPRYEDAKVYENSKSSDKNGRWITVHPNGEDSKGTHLFIKDGETAKEAIDRKFGKKEDKKQPKDYDQALAECQTEEEIREFFVDQFGDNKTADFYTRNELKLRAKEKAAKEKKEVAKKEKKEAAKKEKVVNYSEPVQKVKDFIDQNSDRQYYTVDDYGYVRAWKQSPHYIPKRDNGDDYEPGYWDAYVGEEYGKRLGMDGDFKSFLKEVIGEDAEVSGRYAQYSRSELLRKIDEKYGEKHNASEDKGHWITIKGSHIFIEDGQSVEDAIKQRQSSSTEKGKAGYKTGAHPMEERSRNKIKEELDETSVKYVEDLDSLKKQIDDKLKKGVEPGERRKLDRVLEKIEDIRAIRKDQAKDGLEGKYKGKDKYDPNELLKDIKKAKEEGHIDDVMDFLGIEKAEKGTAFLGAELEGKYAEEDADFDPEQMKKDIKKAQSIGYKTVESIASFLGLDEDEVRETLASDDKKDISSIGKANFNGTRFTFNEDKESMGFARPIYKDLDKAKGLYESKLHGQKLAEEENFKRSGKSGIPLRDKPVVVESPTGEGYIVATVGLEEKYGLTQVYPIDKTKAGKRSSFDEEGFKKFVEANKNKEKHNSKEDTMNVEEFFNKMGEIIEEKFNACKGKMNEADEEEKENEDDDKFEMDGEVYSKKELVNAFKEKKNAEDEEEKEEEDEEEEKQNSNDEFFNAMEQRMLQYNKEEGDKVQVYTQQKGLERGKAIYGK